MDTENSRSKVKEVETTQKVDNSELNQAQKKILSKDEEIKALKAKLAEAQKINKIKKGDIRAEVNRQGDEKLICIGVDDFGKRIWKRASKLTDSEIEMRNKYISEIKQMNAKKTN